MANPIKGEIGFSAGTLGSFKLVYDFNALCALEDALDVPVSELPAMFANGVRAKVVRTVFRIGLEAHHPDVPDTLAGDIIHEVGAEAAAELIGKALSASFPAAGKATPGNRRAAPMAAGTSPTS